MEKLSASERQAELAQRVGTVLGGRYRLDRLLGVGGMGGVYEARPTAGGDPVAVKLLSVADPASRERIAGRFAREAKAVSAVRCPHIVSILEAGSESGRPFIAMELLRGEDLGQRLRRLGKLPLRDTLHVAAQILVALGTAHEAGIVHRDLKPDNVFLLDKDGDPFFCKLLDFGMSKLTPGENKTIALALTKKGMAVGTPYYMAPEQARALADVDGRADLWALGAIVFECLVGRPPFNSPAQEQVLLDICTKDAPDVRVLQPQLPERVAKLVARALARDRGARFLSAWQMLAELIEVAPAESRLMPVKAYTAFDLRAPNAPAMIAPASQVARAVADASGPNRALADASGPNRAPANASGPHRTLVAAPLDADASGPYGPPPGVPHLHPRHSPAPAHARRRHAPPPPSSSRWLLVLMAFSAILLGLGVTLYAVAKLHQRPPAATMPR